MATVEMWTFTVQTPPNLDLSGFKVEATDGDIGKVDEATNEVGSSFIIVDTGPWIFGKKVMLPAGVIRDIDPDTETIFVNHTKDEIKNAPEFDEERYRDQGVPRRARRLLRPRGHTRPRGPLARDPYQRSRSPASAGLRRCAMTSSAHGGLRPRPLERGAQMSTTADQSLSHVSAISLFVEDVQTAKSFYEAIFGVEVVFEDETSVCVKFDQLFVNLLLSSSAEQQVEPAPVAGRDVRVALPAQHLDRRRRRGVRCPAGARRELLTGPVDRPWGMRVATFTDPDGHSWEIAQGLGS